MSSALTLLPPSPSPSKLKYATVLDAGSSATRVYVYSWDASQGDENLKVTKVYPDEEALAKEKNGSVVLERTPGFAKMTPEKNGIVPHPPSRGCTLLPPSHQLLISRIKRPSLPPRNRRHAPPLGDLPTSPPAKGPPSAE